MPAPARTPAARMPFVSRIPAAPRPDALRAAFRTPAPARTPFSPGGDPA